MDLVVSRTLVIPDADLRWSAVRASGAGGQNVNKVNSKVDLRFDLAGTSALTEQQKERLRAALRGRLDADGWIIVTSQLTRDQPRNLEDARQKLAALVARALTPRKKRKATKPSKAAKQRRLGDKRARAETKQGRQRVRED